MTECVLVTLDASGSSLAAGPSPADGVFFIAFDFNHASFTDMEKHAAPPGAEQTGQFFGFR